MEILNIEETPKSPQILFDPGTGILEISGRSYMDDPYEFYKQPFIWLDSYIKVPLSSTTLNIRSDYFNTTSYKCLLDVIKRLESVQDHNHDVKVIWFYDKDDDEIKEAGEDLQEITMLTILVKESETETSENPK